MYDLYPKAAVPLSSENHAEDCVPLESGFFKRYLIWLSFKAKAQHFLFFESTPLSCFEKHLVEPKCLALSMASIILSAALLTFLKFSSFHFKPDGSLTLLPK